MTWVVIAVLLALASLGVLAALSWRVWTEVRTLGRELAAASERIGTATDQIAAAGDPLRPVTYETPASRLPGVGASVGSQTPSPRRG